MNLIKIAATGDTSQPFCPRAGSAADSAAERARQYLYSNLADGCHLGFSGRLAAYDNPAFSWCELTVVIAGELRIADAAGRVTQAGPGEAVVISRGARCTIDQSRLEKRCCNAAIKLLKHCLVLGFKNSVWHRNEWGLIFSQYFRNKIRYFVACRFAHSG